MAVAAHNAVMVPAPGTGLSPASSDEALVESREWSLALCVVAMTMGASGVAGWLLDEPYLQAVLPASRPVAGVTGLLLIAIGAAVLALRSNARHGRTIAIAVGATVVLTAAAELLLFPPIAPPVAGPTVHIFPVTSALLIAVAAALLAIAAGKDLAAHVIASAVLVITTALLFGYVFAIPMLIAPSNRITPVASTDIALVCLSMAELLVKPRGWVGAAASRTPAGSITRLLLVAAIAVPFIGGVILKVLEDQRWYTPQLGLTVLVVANAIFGAALIVGAGAALRSREARERELEKERRATALYARSLIEASLDPLVTISPAGKITDVNAATEAATGLPRHTLIGSDFSDYFTEPERARAGYGKVLEEGAVRDYALSIRHTSGRIADVLYNATTYRDPDGRVRGVFAAARDITERKAAEDERRRAALYARSLIEASLDPLVTISPAGKITDVNAATEVVTGVPRQTLIGTDFSNYFTEPEEARLGYRKVLDEGEVRDYPLSIRHTSGRIADVLYNATTYRDEEGRVQGVFAAARDITDRKRAEEERRRAALYARSLIEASLDPLVTISPSGKIMDVNAATELVTGLSRQMLVGSDFSDYFTEPDRAREGYRKVLEEGEVRDYPLSIRHASGRITDVLYNATTYRDEEGRVQGVFAAARDITDRKRAEEQIARAMADLERSNRDLEQFAYVASHDLQEPLRMVSSYTQLLAQRYSGKLDHDANDFIRYAVDGANRMQRLITDLLMYSRVGTRGKPIERTDSHGALGRAVANLAAAIDETGALVTNDELPVVYADEGQLTQVFQNLIGNSIKFRKPDVPPRVHVSAVRDGPFWKFSVRDNGIGIDPEFHERVFVIFQRLHGRDEYAGTGIGLSICKRIVERHGGRIWVDSQRDAGAMFSFTLPAVRITEDPQ